MINLGTPVEKLWNNLINLPGEALEQPDKVHLLKLEALQQPEGKLHLESEDQEQPEGILQLIDKLDNIVDHIVSE